MRSALLVFLPLTLAFCSLSAWPLPKKVYDHKDAQPSKLERYIEEVTRKSNDVSNASPGSLYSTTTARLGDAFRDVRAGQIFDLVTIEVAENTSAVSTGVTNTARKSAVNASVTGLAGNVKTAALSNLANIAGNQQLQGQGTTSRTSTLTTNLTAEVVAVLPNGNLVLKGSKEIAVNSEHQTVTVQGIVRPADLSSTNSITSDRVAQLEVFVNGKGVVNDSVRRPNFLYRLLLGILPF